MSVESVAESIPAGYKQTEVGVIPEDWEVKRLVSVCSMKSGEGITSADIDEYSPFPCYGGNGLRGYTKRYTHDGSYALIGRQGALCGNVLGVAGQFFASEHAVVVTPFPQTDICWLKFVLRNMNLNQYSESSAQPGLSVLKLSDLPLAFPPTLAEQEAIATALSDTDALIESLEQLIAKKRQIKQGAMQELLTGKRRLPGFESYKGYKHTEVGVFPEEWSLFPLADVVEPTREIRYGIVQPGKFDSKGRYMIRGQDYSEVKGWANPSDLFRVSSAIEERYRNARVKSGDLIITIVGYCGHVEMVPDWLDGANLTQTTARISIDPEKAERRFCKYMLLSPLGRMQVATNMKGGAQPGLNCEDIKKFLIPLPSLAEQTSIATILSDMDSEITALDEKLAKTRQIKQGMMQELLTGRIRLV